MRGIRIAAGGSWCQNDPGCVTEREWSGHLVIGEHSAVHVHAATAGGGSWQGQGAGQLARHDSIQRRAAGH
jgi:hypothetical protein